MDTPQPESTAQPEQGGSLQDRLANIVQNTFGEDVGGYEPVPAEPQGQPAEDASEAVDEPEASEPEQTEEAAPQEDTPAEPDLVEVEDETGAKHKVPAHLKSRFMADK